MNKPYNIQNTNTCNGIFHISFFKALLINEGETTWGEKGIGAKRLGGETTQGANGNVLIFLCKVVENWHISIVFWVNS